MRTRLFFFILSVIFLAVLLWAFSGIVFILGLVIWILYVFIGANYSDKVVLSFLRARQWQPVEKPEIFEAILHEAYKLDMPAPQIYTYYGFFHRTFIFSRKKNMTLVFDRHLLEELTPKEIGLVSFFLMIEAKAKISSKRNLLFYIAGILQAVWYIPVAILAKLQKHNFWREALEWWEDYLLLPWMEIMFKMLLGKKFFKEINNLIAQYPVEKEELKILQKKMLIHDELKSFSFRSSYRLGQQGRGLDKKLLLLMEFFPHEIEQVWATHE